MSSNEFRIRKTEVGDAFYLPPVERSAGQVFKSIPELAFIADDQITDVAGHLAAIDAGKSWVAINISDSSIIGFLVGEQIGADLYIGEFSVAAPWQGQGVGRALLKQVMLEAKREGFSRLTLTTFRDVLWNGPFYGKLGFVILSSENTDAYLRDTLRAEAEHGIPVEQRCAMALKL
ncbi:GNAT family N-acetyltransferase [Microvirga sp. W0021]|uniref:GNAT family N-acetyltransferase n=1 Tax=Hohaiivirga grylli TaxID=3133970 RepID=A0ABV0BG40_9HYPH